VQADRIVIVLDPLFGARLGQVADHAFVWFATSPANHAWMQVALKEGDVRPFTEWTWSQPEAGMRDHLEGMVEAAIEHHGRPAEVLVYGGLSEQDVSAVLRDYHYGLVGVAGDELRYKRVERDTGAAR